MQTESRKSSLAEVARDALTVMRSKATGNTHAERLENYYKSQAHIYDRTRPHMLHGRRELMGRLPLGGHWVDIGSGTGGHLEYIHERITEFDRITCVDLCGPLLDVLRARCERNDWHHVSIQQQDATKLVVPSESVDLVTMSYSLSMMPEWFAVIDEAQRILKPGGHIALVDFHLPPLDDTHPVQVGWLARWLWMAIYDLSSIWPRRDLLPYLRRRFTTQELDIGMGKLPQCPLFKLPYLVYLGQKA